MGNWNLLISISIWIFSIRVNKGVNLSVQQCKNDGVIIEDGVRCLLYNILTVKYWCRNWAHNLIKTNNSDINFGSFLDNDLKGQLVH